jgi:4-amino-4-deoxy-L-arabinose transferase-like glycosyltransferase
MLGLAISWMALSGNKHLFYLLAGLTWGTAYLTRHEGIGYLLFLILIILIRLFKEKKIRCLGHLFLLLAGFLMVSTPYLIYLKRDTGNWTIGKQAVMNITLGEQVGRVDDWGMAYEKCYFSLSEDGKQVGYETLLERQKNVRAYALSHPAELARRYVVNLHLINKYVIPGLVYPFVLILFGAGLFLGDAERTKKASVLFLAFVPYLAFPFFIVDPRYFLPFVPIIIIWAARGIVEASSWIAALRKDAPSTVTGQINRKRLIEMALIILVIMSFIPFTFRSFLRHETGAANIYKETGRWIQSNLPQGSVLICRRPFIPFYAGKEQVPLPFATLDKILKFARDRGADYLIADENEAGERPGMESLLEEVYPVKDLKMVHKFKDISGKKVFIYQILD